MVCRLVNRYMLDYHEGELKGIMQHITERHLPACERCQRSLRALERNLQMLREALSPRTEMEIPGHMWHRVRAQLPPKPPRARTKTRVWAVTGGLVLAVTSLYLVKSLEPGIQEEIGKPGITNRSKDAAMTLEKILSSGIVVESVDMESKRVIVRADPDDCKEGDSLKIYSYEDNPGTGLEYRQLCDVEVIEAGKGSLWICKVKPSKGQVEAELLKDIRKYMLVVKNK
jgi:hypothetical protein